MFKSDLSFKNLSFFQVKQNYNSGVLWVLNDKVKPCMQESFCSICSYVNSKDKMKGATWI